MRLATSTSIHQKLLWKDEMFYSCEESITACADAGYKVLDMHFGNFSRDGQPMAQQDWKSWINRQRELADSWAVEFSQAHAPTYVWAGASDLETNWNEELVQRAIIGSEIIGVKWLVMHSGSMRDDTWYSYKKSLKANREHFLRYAEIAHKHKVGIAIENMIESKLYKRTRRFGSSSEELLELLDVLDDPIFGICWDTGHAHVSNINQPGALMDIGKNLKALHIADNNGQTDDHNAPYFGTIHWAPILETLKKIHYTGDFSFEIYNFAGGLPAGLHENLLRFSRELGEYMLKQTL